MPQAKKVALGQIARVVVRKKGAVGAQYWLVSGSPKPQSPEDDVEVVRVFSAFQPFALPIHGTEFKDKPPLVVYYRITPPGTLEHSTLTPEYWEGKKACFIAGFSPQVNAFRNKLKLAMLTYFEEEGDMIKMANVQAKTCNWSISIFGVGRSIETSDPFTI